MATEHMTEQQKIILQTWAEAKSEYEAKRDATAAAKSGIPQLEADSAVARGVLKQARVNCLKHGVTLPKTSRGAAEEADAD